MKNYDLTIAHKASMYNRSVLENDKKCGCFYCLRVFSPSEIKEWCDESENEEAEFYREQRAKFIKLQKEVRKLGNHATQRNMLNSAATQRGDSDIEFNCHNHLLVVQNGTVDLRTGNLLPHVPGYYITMRADVKYDPAAQEPKRFLQFLNEIFDNNQELIDYVHDESVLILILME